MIGPLAAGTLATAVSAAYVPALRDQRRRGTASVPLTGFIDPVILRRADHPLAFRLCLATQAGLVALILSGGIALVAQGLFS